MIQELPYPDFIHQDTKGVYDKVNELISEIVKEKERVDKLEQRLRTLEGKSKTK